MPATRRAFLKTTAAAAALVSLGRAGHARGPQWAAPRDVAPASRKLRLLFLGGTRFLGPHTVQHALARGHAVTLFNRGKTAPDLFADLDQRRGDRAVNDYASLADGHWDAVIDTSAHRPHWVREAAAALQGRCPRCLYVSSTGVYWPYHETGIDESGALAAPPDDLAPERITGENFGGLKVACERAARAAFPDRTAVVRPHLIAGPGDNSDRFTYWPARLARGGEVLAPPADDPVQWIDARDLAAFMIQTLEDDLAGDYNVVGPRGRYTVAGLLHGIRGTLSEPSELVFADREFLAAQGIGGWMDLTVWVPPVEQNLGMNAIDGSKALAAGLAPRPLADTARDTLRWWQDQPAARRKQPRAGLPAAREAELLAAWRQRRVAAGAAG